MPLEHEKFQYRHIGTSNADQKVMLDTLGYNSLDDLLSAAVPEVIRFRGDSTLDPARSEAESLAELRAIAAKNRVTTSMIGLGYYGTHTPTVIKRNILENPSWYTAYTPYQPEISQGRLEALINFQTMVTDLTGMKTSNASMLDESTAAVEAMMIAKRTATSDSNVFLVDRDTFPQTKALLEHRAQPLQIEIKYFDNATHAAGLGEHFGSLLQYPGASGRVVHLKPVIELTKTQGGISVVVCRWALVAHTRVTSQCATTSSARCLAAWSAFRLMPTVHPPTDSHCRLANSTFVANEQPQTFAPLRYCSPLWPECMRSITAQLA